MAAALKRTKLFDFHVAQKARIVPFAGWEMPVQYPEGIIKEHLHTRSAAGLFDVSHMRQVRFVGADRIKFMEWVTVGDYQALKPNNARLSVIMKETGGVVDDTMITRYDDHLYVVINAGRADADTAYFEEKLKEFRGDVAMEIIDESLVALQGPKAKVVLSQYVDNLDSLYFLSGRRAEIKGMPVLITRCGYTGEDGFEVAASHHHISQIAELFVSNPDVKMIGLGARDTLRIEAGMCLYGHELSEDINPLQADLGWLITKRRWEEGGFIAYDKLKAMRANPTELVPRVRVGIKAGAGPCPRDHATVHSEDGKTQVGEITSGSPSPSLGCNITQAFVDRALRVPGTKVVLNVRGKIVPGEVVKLPFVPSKYYRAPSPPPKA